MLMLAAAPFAEAPLSCPERLAAQQAPTHHACKPWGMSRGETSCKTAGVLILHVIGTS